MKLKASFLAFLTMATILFGVYVFTKSEQQQYQEKVRAEVLGQLRASQARLEGGLYARLFLEKGLIAFILTRLEMDPQHKITQEEVNRFGAEFMPQLSGINNFTLIQNNKITHIYPLDGNEKMIGIDLSLLPDQNRALQQVIESRSMIIAGPIQLIEGGVGLVSRTPIYWTPQGKTEAVYWGQVSLALSQERLFAEAGLYDQSSMLKFAVRGRDGLGKDGGVFWGEEGIFLENPVIVNVKVSNGLWQLAAVPTKGWERYSPAFIWIWLVGGFLAICSAALVWFLIYYREVQTSLHCSEESLIESEEQFRQMFTKQEVIMYLVDPETYDILNANEAAQKFYGYSLETFKQMKITHLNLLSTTELREVLTKAFQEKSGQWEFKHRLANGEIRDVEVRMTLIGLRTKQFFFIIAHDISERKKTEERLRYVTFHDSLTGLYARSYFEEEIRRLDMRRSGVVGLMVCDLDGLKLVNDTLGHESGDQMLINAASIFKNSFRDGDVVSRVGGDEFVVIMENITREHMEEACQRLKNGIRMNNESNQDVPVSLSIGFAISSGPSMTMRELFKEADNNMYREKLHRGQKARSAIVQTVVNLLAERDFIIDGHGDRLQDMVSSLAKAMGLSERKIRDMRLLAQFHDIGKVGISEKILMKEEPLTPEEAMEMRRHCEIGQRIALSAPDLTSIADWILKHQEWWDGTGYPLGIAGEDIPIECRILAIADAYDAMTNDRPYRKGMPHDKAIEELKRCAGTQFDPMLIEKFCEIMGACDEKNRIES
ncbi:HD domain-containing phosphohydrolase [Pelosinus fermentans]|uniref:Diguanylate cyclase with PAS/PAC sensor n=1 Tax=Pelosinus fermentans JBW45 TaxID=1192197 RepID=I8TM46_9FIRM|nr:HD domain-containing phosphohydrolase [Pelosinus fermentans]AJQ29172.1 diguanylate cyclase with PAS/PAC sensor [Pelosinus fermentans JBW45]